MRNSKKRILLFLGFFLCFNNFFAQNSRSTSIYQIAYKYEFVRDTTNAESRVVEPMLLYFNQTSSSFYSSVEESAMKSINEQFKNSGGSEINLGNVPKSKVRYSVYRQNNNVYVTSPIGRDVYTFSEPILNSWNVDYLETKEILGYKCRKATIKLNRSNYIAWYAADIPFQEGPYRFKGLPGLILELYDTKGFNRFTALSILKKEIEILPLRKGIYISRKEYLRKRQEFIDNPFPDKIIVDKVKKDNILKSLKQYNNLIEK